MSMSRSMSRSNSRSRSVSQGQGQDTSPAFVYGRRNIEILTHVGDVSVPGLIAIIQR